jgi:hypothetical protein
MLKEQEESEDEYVSDEEIIEPNTRPDDISQENSSHINILAGGQYHDGSTGGIQLYPRPEQTTKPSDRTTHQNRDTIERINELNSRLYRDKSSQDEGESNSKVSKFMIDHEEHSSYPDIEKVSKLLKDFKPEELIQKASTKEKIQSF